MSMTNVLLIVYIIGYVITVYWQSKRLKALEATITAQNHAIEAMKTVANIFGPEKMKAQMEVHEKLTDLKKNNEVQQISQQYEDKMGKLSLEGNRKMDEFSKSVFKDVGEMAGELGGMLHISLVHAGVPKSERLLIATYPKNVLAKKLLTAVFEQFDRSDTPNKSA